MVDAVLKSDSSIIMLRFSLEHDETACNVSDVNTK